MAILEYLIGSLGISISHTLLRVWLKESPVLDAMSKSALDIIKSKTDNFLAARKAAREFDALADKIGESLEPVFESYNTSDESRKLVANEVATAVSSANIDSQLLARLSFNPKKLLDHIKQVYSIDNKFFSEVENALYNRSLDLASQYIVELAPQLPKYNSQTFTEILSRFDVLTGILHRILEDLDILQESTSASNVERQNAEFERDYRAAIIRKFDRLNLFGADLSRRTKRYQLSVAYVSLDVFTNEAEGKPSEQRMPVEDALAITNFSAIIGEAGTGKTTLLYWLAVNSASKRFSGKLSHLNNLIPFVIELRRYTDGLPSPNDFVANIVSEISHKMPKIWISEVLDGGRGLLLVDGLDEVPAPKRTNVFSWLEDLIGTYKLRVIFTSRPGAPEWTRLVDDLNFTQFNMAPMSIDHIKMFVDHWHNAVLDEGEIESKENIRMISEKLYSKIMNSTPLMKISTNPLLCAMLCALHYERNMQLPSDRITLYEECCIMLLERRDVERELSDNILLNLGYRQKRVLLDDLAYWMLKNGKTSIVIEDVILRFNSRLENMRDEKSKLDSREVLFNFIERSGIIRERNPGFIDFIHRSFQEYMAANASALEGDWGLLVKNANDDQWHETIVLAAGFTNQKQADELILDLLKQREKTHNEQYDLIAMSCLETAIEVSASVRKEVKKRIDFLIPPKGKIQINALAATGDLVVPFLGFNRNYTKQEILNCINLLGMIGGNLALSQLATYISKKDDYILNAIKNILKTTSPTEINSSQLCGALLNFLDSLKRNKTIELSGTFIYSLSKTPLSKIKKALTPNKVRKLYITEFSDSVLSIFPFFPDLTDLGLKGTFNDFRELSVFENLCNLELKNESPVWPTFEGMRGHEILQSILIGAIGDDWPNIGELVQFTNLKELTILSFDGPEINFEIFNEIALIKKLRYLHIISTKQFDLDVAMLSHLDNLREIEISALPHCFPEIVISLSDLPHLKKIMALCCLVWVMSPKVNKLSP